MLTQPLPIRLEGDAERVRQSHHNAIRELQDVPIVGAVLVRDVAIPNNGTVLVSHKLGRRPVFVWLSAPRVALGSGAVSGSIFDVLGTGADRTQTLSLTAADFGTTVTVDVMVF